MADLALKGQTGTPKFLELVAKVQALKRQQLLSDVIEAASKALDNGISAEEITAALIALVADPEVDELADGLSVMSVDSAAQPDDSLGQ